MEGKTIERSSTDSKKDHLRFGKKNKDLIIKAIDYTDNKGVCEPILEDVLELDEVSAKIIYDYLISDYLNITVDKKKTVKEFISIIKGGIKSSEILLKRLKGSIGEERLEEATKKTISIYKKEIQKYKAEKDLNDELSLSVPPPK